MNITYTTLIQIIESFASEHLEVRRFKADFAEQITNFGTEDTGYPILYCGPNSAAFNSESSSDYSQFTLNLYSFDLIIDDRKNINTILNTTSLILNDLHKYFKDGEIEGVTLINASQLQPLNNSLLDFAAGWQMSLTLEVDTYSVCSIS